MVEQVIKRNGDVVKFNRDRISEAILKANKDVIGRQKASVKLAKTIAKEIAEEDKNTLNVEDIQDIVCQKLMEINKNELAQRYILYKS